MKSNRTAGLVALSLIAPLLLGGAPVCRAAEIPSAGGRQTLAFDQAWHFHLGEVDGGEKPELADSAWRLLDVPHDFSIEGPPGADPAAVVGPFDRQSPSGWGGGRLNGGIGWYRKTWPEAKIVYPNAAAYCDIAVLPDGRIAVLFEPDSYKAIDLAILPAMD